MTSAVKRSISFTITEKAPTRAFSLLKATDWSFIALALQLNWGGDLNNHSNEDCLYLNVYVPKTQIQVFNIAISVISITSTVSTI